MEKKKEQKISALFGVNGCVQKLGVLTYEFLGDRQHRTLCLHLDDVRTMEINVYALQKVIDEALEEETDDNGEV